MYMVYFIRPGATRRISNQFKFPPFFIFHWFPQWRVSTGCSGCSPWTAASTPGSTCSSTQTWSTRCWEGGVAPRRARDPRPSAATTCTPATTLRHFQNTSEETSGAGERPRPRQTRHWFCGEREPLPENRYDTVTYQPSHTRPTFHYDKL